jgi:hypothetical protein
MPLRTSTAAVDKRFTEVVFVLAGWVAEFLPKAVAAIPATA